MSPPPRLPAALARCGACVGVTVEPLEARSVVTGCIEGDERQEELIPADRRGLAGGHAASDRVTAPVVMGCPRRGHGQAGARLKQAGRVGRGPRGRRGWRRAPSSRCARAPASIKLEIVAPDRLRTSSSVSEPGLAFAFPSAEYSRAWRLRLSSAGS